MVICLKASLTGHDAEIYQNVVQTIMHNHHNQSLYSLENMEMNKRDNCGRIIVSEGIRNSACLIALRQEIWSVLVFHRPFRLPLEVNIDYGNLGPADDFTWTNRIVLWCADVLRFCFGPDSTTSEVMDNSCAFETWDALQVFDKWWMKNAPPCFKPYHYAPPDASTGNLFPTVWHFNDAHMIAMQHLELGRMLLKVYNPRRQRVGIGSIAANKAIEQSLRDSVMYLCGLALANTKFQGGMTTAAIGISLGGEYFRNSEEQNAILYFLNLLEEVHAWPTQSSVSALHEAWNG